MTDTQTAGPRPAVSSSSAGTHAVVLLSGGLDSATVLAIARDQRYRCHSLSFRYGQRHNLELDAAQTLSDQMGCESHIVIDLDLGKLADSALTGQVEVPKHRSDAELGGDIPVTYVPARNIIFLSFAAARAEGVGARDIFLGVNAVDYSGYPDCRPEFLRAYENTLNLGTKAGAEGRSFTVHAPLISMSKADIIREGTRLGVNYGLTRSCYDPDEKGRACGACDSCLLRCRGFEEAGVANPTVYQK